MEQQPIAIIMTDHGTRNNFGMLKNSSSSSSTGIDPIEDLNRTLYDIGAFMKHFLEGIAPLRHWNPNEKSNTYKSKLTSKTLTEHFLQGNVPLRYLLNAKPPLMS